MFGAADLPPEETAPKKPLPVGTIVRSALGVLIVVGLVAAVLIGYPKATDWADEMAQPVADVGTTIPPPTTTAPPTTAPKPRNPVPVSHSCRNRANGAPTISAMPAQPAPVPDAPGQHALLVKPLTVHGNLDLAPGGGFTYGNTPASDAKTVFAVCASEIDASTTSSDCLFEETRYGIPTGNQYTSKLAYARYAVDVYELRSGRLVGSGVVQATGGSCPGPGQSVTDYSDGIYEVHSGLDEQLVQWARDHLTGARYH
jgi:hypothetical protein